MAVIIYMNDGFLKQTSMAAYDYPCHLKLMRQHVHSPDIRGGGGGGG